MSRYRGCVILVPGHVHSLAGLFPLVFSIAGLACWLLMLPSRGSRILSDGVTGMEIEGGTEAGVVFAAEETWP